MTKPTVIETRKVTKTYNVNAAPVPALVDISFAAEENCFVSLVGPSGCGKSTLLQILAGLIPSSSGEVLVDGMPVRKPMPDKIAVVFQDATLLPWKTVIQNIEFPLEVQKVPPRERRECARAMLSLVGLSDFAERYPHELSGGMRQRVSIARAFANDPEILLMDEPFSALDAQNKLLLQEELLHIWEEHKKTVVFITHSVDEAVFLGDRIMVMTAQPGKVKTFVPVPLARPRDIMELQKMPQYGELIAHIWSSLREEVHRARQQEEEIKS